MDSFSRARKFEAANRINQCYTDDLQTDAATDPLDGFNQAKWKAAANLQFIVMDIQNLSADMFFLTTGEAGNINSDYRPSLAERSNREVMENMAYLVEGYYFPGDHDNQTVAFEQAKINAIRPIREAINNIKALTAEDFFRITQNDFPAPLA